MSYTPFHDPWEDFPSEDTPITAAALDYIEAGIEAAAASADAAQAALALTAFFTPELVQALTVMTQAQIVAAGKTALQDALVEVAANTVFEVASTGVLSLLGGNGNPPVSAGTEFPTSPPDGAEHLLILGRKISNLAVWRFRYNAVRATNKWEFIGGPPLVQSVTAAEATAATAYGNLTTVGPSVWIPAAGLYLVEVGFVNTVTSGAAGISRMSYAIGATAAADADAAQSWSFSSSVGGLTHVHKRALKTFTGAIPLLAVYKTSAGTQTLADRVISVTPIAVGG